MHEFLNEWVLTIMIFAPAAGAVVVFLLPAGWRSAIKGVSVVASGAALLAGLWLYGAYDREMPAVGTFNRAAFGAANVEAGEHHRMLGLQFVQQLDWIGAFRIQYFVGVDGLSISMVLLTALISFLALVASFGIDHWSVSRGVKGYFALFLLLEAGMMGVFCALDFILFYVFWEVMLLPMYFLIGIWGGPRREYAAIKFFLYTLLGSVLMLVVILAFYFTAGRHFDMTKLMVLGAQGKFVGGVDLGPLGWLGLTDWWRLAFVALYIGFAIKIPAFPFHTWLPDAHVEAPTPVSVVLASILLKMGTYGLLRVNYMILPEATRWFAPAMMFLGMVNILYGALCAMAQITGVRRVNPRTGEVYVERDWKKLIAYSSISHMGFCMIGMAACTSAGIHGAIFQMWNHGIITGMLFLIAGVIYDRAHHRDIDKFGGLWSVMPNYGGVTALAFMASLGLPGLAGFISEALCLVGAFQAHEARDVTYLFFEAKHYYHILTAISALGVVLGAGYFLWSYQKIFLGPLNPKYENLPDMTGREWFTLAPLGAITLLLGIYPAPILGLLSGSADVLVKLVQMPWVGG